MFGGDGAYGEAKAALDAIVAKWRAERTWGDRVTLVHAIIGWVRGTGLMGGNDPLVEAVEAAGVRTWTPDDMAEALLDTCTPESRTAAAEQPLTVDLTGGLAEIDVDLKALAAEVEPPAAETVEETPAVAALAPSPAQLPTAEAPEPGATVTARPEDMVVIVGAGELGPYGSARTRFEMEVDEELSAAGVLELAWSTGLVTWDDNVGGWYDTESGDAIDESEIHERYHDTVVERCGIRTLRRRRLDAGQLRTAADVGLPRPGPHVRRGQRGRGPGDARRRPRAHRHRVATPTATGP